MKGLLFLQPCLLIATLLAAASPAGADEREARALEVFGKHKAAVVTVEMVISQNVSFMGMDNESEESRTETTGTVIDASGLTVISLSATDPTGLLTSMMGGMMEDTMKMQSEVKDVRILADDLTIPAAVVLRDKDNDLAFVRPTAPPETPPTFIDLADSSEPALLDTLVIIQRMGRVANRVHAVSLTQIKALVERPRRFYLADTDAIGAPALSLDGKCAGVFVMRTIAGEDSSSPLSMLSGMQNSMSLILIPASTIREGAAQAPAVEAAAPEGAVE